MAEIIILHTNTDEEVHHCPISRRDLTTKLSCYKCTFLTIETNHVRVSVVAIVIVNGIT